MLRAYYGTIYSAACEISWGGVRAPVFSVVCLCRSEEKTAAMRAHKEQLREKKKVFTVKEDAVNIAA